MQEEEFWLGRLSALSKPQNPVCRFLLAAAAAMAPAAVLLGACQPTLPARSSEAPPPCRDGGATAILAHVPARQQHSALQQKTADALEQPQRQQTSAGSGTVTGAPSSPALQPDNLFLAAQVEALKLQVSQLRRSNAQLQQQLAAAAVEQVALTKHASLQQLAQLRASLLSAESTAAAEAAATVLQSELGVQLPSAADAVPLDLVQRLHDSFQSRLEALQQQHQAALRRLHQAHEAALALQVGR